MIKKIKTLSKLTTETEIVIDLEKDFGLTDKDWEELSDDERSDILENRLENYVSITWKYCD